MRVGFSSLTFAIAAQKRSRRLFLPRLSGNCALLPNSFFRDAKQSLLRRFLSLDFLQWGFEFTDFIFFMTLFLFIAFFVIAKFFTFGNLFGPLDEQH